MAAIWPRSIENLVVDEIVAANERERAGLYEPGGRPSSLWDRAQGICVVHRPATSRLAQPIRPGSLDRRDDWRQVTEPEVCKVS